LFGSQVDSAVCQPCLKLLGCIGTSGQQEVSLGLLQIVIDGGPLSYALSQMLVDFLVAELALVGYLVSCIGRNCMERSSVKPQVEITVR
jgi:hypothetical protein